MSLEASTLNVVVQSSGVGQATEAMNKYALAADKAEKSTAKLSKSTKGVDTSAKQQEKVWYDLMQKSAKYYEQQFNAQQRHNNKLFGLVQAEANRMNRQMDSITKQDASNFAKRRAQEQKQLEDLDVLRRNASAKEYARAQSDATKLNAMMDRQRKQQEAAAKASAERQRVLNASYSSASLAQQIATLQKAQAYSSQGGNASARYGSTAGSAASSGELTRLQQQYRQLNTDARRANATMADTHAAVRGLSGSLGALWVTYGNLLPLIAGAGIGMALKGIVAVGADIEHTLEKIRVLAVTTTKEIDDMRAVIFDMGKGVQGPRDVAQAFSVLTLAGLNAKEAMQGVGAALNLAVAGDVSIEKASTTLVQISTSLGYTALDFNHLADVIAKTAAVSMSSVDSISGAFLSAAAVGEVYGASLQDIGLGLATVANLGIQATAAGTTLKNFYADLSKGTEKSTKTLKAMGLSLRDLKDANGGFIDLVDLVTKLEAGFSKLNPQARAEAMDKLFGERGIKTGAALIAQVNELSTEMDVFGNTYKNKLEEVADQISKSAAFSTLAAIAMAQTTTNQLKSVGNTLQTVLGQAFEAVAPQIGVVARELKKAFNSPEFASGLMTIAKGVADLTVAIVKNFDVIVKLAAAYAAFKFTMFAAGLVSIAQGFTVAAIGARAFAVSLGPIGVAIAGLTALWAIYKANKNDALNNTAGAQNLSEYTDGVLKSAETENAIAEMREKGSSELDIARKRQMEDDKNAAAQAIKVSKKGLSDMKAQLDTEYSTLSDYQKKRIDLVKKGQATFTGDSTAQKFLAKEKDYNAALTLQGNQIKVVTAATETLIKNRQRNAELADKAAKQGQIKPTGDGELGGGEGEKAAKKALNFIQNEALELNKLRAGYDAKNAAMRQSIELGKHVAAEAQQAIVMENLLAGKYGSKSEDNKMYQAQMRLAMLADEAKAENEKLKKVNEFATKLAELEAAQKAYNMEAMEGSLSHFGALRKEAEGLIQVTSMSEKAAEALRIRADAMDAYKKQQEAIVKLNNAADSSRNRAAEALEEAETMKKYGEVTKLGAIAVAQLVIEKSKLDDATGKVAKSTLLEVAATEQLNTAYRELVKQQIDINKAAADAQAEGKLIFANSEADKVAIANETRKKLMAIEYQKVQDAYVAKESMGKATPEDFSTFSNAYNAYIESVNKSDQVASMETNNLKLKDWKKTVDDIEQIGREGFYNLTEKGVGLWKSMANTFKSMFKTTVMDYIYKEFAKPIMMKVIASIAGVAGADGLSQAASAMGGGGSGASGAINLLSTGKKVYDMFQSGLSGMGNSFAAGFSQYVGPVMESMGSMFGSSAVSSFGAGLGANVAGSGNAAMFASAQTSGNLSAGAMAGQSAGAAGGAIAGAASIAGGVAGGIYGGRAISNGFSAFGGSGNSAVNTGTAIGAVVGSIIPVIGTALGALVGGLLGGAVNRLFGHKPKEITSQGVRGTLSSESASGEEYANWKQKGGWFRSDKKGTDISAMSAEMGNSLVGGFNQLKAATSDVAKNLGVSSDALIGYSKQFDIVLTTDAAKNEEALAKFFTDMGDEMATKLVPNIMEFANKGESAAAALERLSGVFDVTKNLADMLGKSVKEVFGSEGMDSAKIRTMLVDLSGGVDALSDRTTAYVNAIYSDTEKLAPVQKALAEAMSGLGFASVTTKEQYRAAVEGIKLTDEASIRLFNSMLELAPAFSQVTDAAAEAAKLATEAAKDAADKLVELNKQAMEKAFDSADSALDRLSAAIDAEKDNIDSKYDAIIDRIKKATEASVDSAKLQVEAAEKQRDAVKTILDSLSAAMQSTVVESVELTRARRTEAQSYLAVSAIQARAGGSVTNMAGLDKALEAIAKPSEDLFSSFEDYARDQAMAAFNIAALQGTAKNELSAAELTIERMNATIESIEKASEDQISAIEKAREGEKEGLDNILNKAQEQLDALKGIDNSLLGVMQALNGFAAATAAVRATEAQQTMGNGSAVDSLYKDILGRGADTGGKSYYTNLLDKGTSVVDVAGSLKGSDEYRNKSISDLYKQIFGRNADAAGLQYWQDRSADGASLKAIEDAFRNSPEYLTKMGIPSYDVGTDNVPKDGLAMIHKGEMIVPASDASSIRRARSEEGSSSEVADLKAAIKELTQVVMSGDISKIQVLKEMLRLDKKWDQEGIPETRDVSLSNVE